MAEKEKKGIKQIGKTISDKTKEKIDSIKENATVAKYTVEAAVDSIIGSIDQTGDGKFDLEDVNELRRQHREKKRLAKLRKDLNALNPVL